MMTATDLAPPSAALPSRPRSLCGQTFAQRFRYWYGLSGRRYLFSEISRDEIADLDGAVVLTPDLAGDRPDYVGREAPPADLAERPIFVHLLADNDADRAVVIADLTPRAA